MKFLKSLLAITVLLSMISCGNQKADVKSLETELDSASYALGLNVAGYIKKSFNEADKDLFYQGFRNGSDSTNLLLSEKDINVVLSSFFQKKRLAERMEAQNKAMKEAELKFADVKKAGEDFLAANKNKPGVKTTPTGLQYIVLKEGKGENVKPTDNIKIHYHGTTIDGDVFDSTVEKNKPYDSKANAFIDGFNEGLTLLKKGSKYRFFIPQEIGYKFQQRGNLIKPFSALIFEVELLEIKK